MEGEGRRSREAVRNSIRTYGVKVMDPASLPLKKTKETESQESVSRFSERSLHSQYEIREGLWKSLLNRIPYATLAAAIVCLLGVLIAVTTGQRAAALTSVMVQDTLDQEPYVVSTVNTIFLVVEITTAITAVMILIIGILATGDTRAQVYKAGKVRLGGRVCCAFLMALSFLLFFLWLLCFWILAALCFLVVISRVLCDVYSSSHKENKCLSLPMLNVFFNGKGDIEICQVEGVKKFCKDYVEKVSSLYYLAEFGTFFIVVGLVMFLICLATNYAKIRCQAKLQELQELRHLEGEHRSSKDRF